MMISVRECIKKLTFTLLFTFISFSAFSECILSVRVTDSIPQYYQDQHKNWKGMGVELTEVLLQEANCSPEYVVYPWKRALSQLREGELDMMVNLSITKEREEYLHFIGPQRDESIMLVVKEDSNFTINSFEDFKALNNKFGIENGAYYGETFQKKITSDPEFSKLFIHVIRMAPLIEMLSINRIAGFFEDRYSSAYKMRTHKNYQSTKAHSFIVNQDLVYFGFSKKSVSSEIINRLKKAYKIAKSQGKFEKVINRYR